VREEVVVRDVFCVVLRSTGQGSCVDWTGINRGTFYRSSDICRHLLQQEMAR